MVQSEERVFGRVHRQNIIIPKGQVWLAGDNEANSRDSRVYGPVPLGLLQGRAWIKLSLHAPYYHKFSANDMLDVEEEQELARLYAPLREKEQREKKEREQEQKEAAQQSQPEAVVSFLDQTAVGKALLPTHSSSLLLPAKNSASEIKSGSSDEKNT